MQHRRGLTLAMALLSACALAREARAQCPTNVPHTVGTWRTLSYQMPINPISATLLHTGKVFLVAGSENDAYNNSTGAVSYRAALWDPTGTDQSSIVTKQAPFDVFCSGTAQLPDGRTLTIGGSATYGFTGDRRASFFDPVTEKFAQAQSMQDGRWYGTATALGDGRIMAFSGTNGAGTATNSSVQIYDLKTAGAGWGSAITGGPAPPLFPRMFLLPSGKVFFTAHGAGTSANSAWIFDPVANTWTASIAKTKDRSYGSAVILPLLPPSYTPKIMMLGGGADPDSKTTEIVDLSAAHPSWTAMANMSADRRQMNATLLPNGTVLAEGGSQSDEVPDAPGRTSDLYDPATNVMNNGVTTGGATASFSRLYHSTSLLLPDATIASMGSNPGSRGRCVTAIEIFTPPYLYDTSDHLITTGRPSITNVSSTVVGYGGTFNVSYTSSSPISSAVLMRPGSTTHASDMEQRMVGLCGPSPQPACTGSGTLTLTTPTNSNVAPPGYYMLFLLDSAGVPSVASWVRLAAVTTAPPTSTITSPASDVTVTAGGSVSFGTGTTATKYSWVFPTGSPSTSTAKNPGNVTFSTPGEYLASLTVLDASNNSDPSPPTRKIKVLPSNADFDISVSPASQVVKPGQSATFTVTITPLSGFSGTVTLSVDSESGFPSGVSSGGFSPATISGSGSSTLTMNTTSSTVPYATSLSLHGVSGSLTHTGSSTLVVNLLPPANLGASTSDSTANLTWNPSTGATGYRIERSVGGATQTIACPSGVGYTDPGLTNGTTYHYAVTAVFTGGADGGGTSSLTSEILATPPCATPTYAGSMTGTDSGSNTIWSWTAGGATTFDLVRGDLMALRSSSGDFQAALDALPTGEPACLANNTTSLSLSDPNPDPSPGGGIFTLIRAVTTGCAAVGSFDDGTQTGSRDAEIDASSRACP